MESGGLVTEAMAAALRSATVFVNRSELDLRVDSNLEIVLARQALAKE